MQTGTKVSGIAHVGLIGWMAFGVGFRSDPEPFETRDVSVISAQDFAALIATQLPPATASQPVALSVPDIPTDTPDIQAQTNDAPEQSDPSETSEPDPEVIPEVVPTTPVPDVPVPDVIPVLQPPQPDISVPADIRPPQVRPIDRVAPQPVAPAPLDARPDDVNNPEVTPDAGVDTPKEIQEATAPEEAADKIVTEADEVESHAPARSIRPPSISRPTATAQPEPNTTPDRNSSVNDALVEALAATVEPTPTPQGPPLSQGEKDALRVSVSRCWNVGSLSTEAMTVTVVVGVSMTAEGKPEIPTIHLISSAGGSDGAAKQAFEAARRAIIRCGGAGYELPADKYDQWRDIEMTFNPERMRIK